MAQSDRSSARRFRLIGIVAIVLGVVGAVALWLIAGKRYDDAVGSLAPAPIGCDTTLVFDRTGTYTFFVETKGSVGEIDGDCDNDDRSYDLDSADVPDVELTLLDEDGQEINLDRVDGPTMTGPASVGAGFPHGRHRDRGIVRLERQLGRARGDGPRRSGSRQRRHADSASAPSGCSWRESRIGVIALWKGRSVWSIPSEPPTPADLPGLAAAWSCGPPVAPPYANPPTPPPYAPAAAVAALARAAFVRAARQRPAAASSAATTTATFTMKAMVSAQVRDGASR